MAEGVDENYYTQNDHLAAIGFQAQPGDIYYMNPPKELSSYPMFIDNPKKNEKTVGSYISYTLDGTDMTEKLPRRYSDFFSLYEKLLQRWPGIYIPRLPPKKVIGNMDPSVIKTRMRLLNRFCLNLSNIEYLYKSEEANIFRNNIPDVANAINKLPELSLADMLGRMKEAFPEYNQNYDVIVGRSKITEFEQFMKKTQKYLEDFMKSVNTASEKNEMDKKQYNELITGFKNYEKENMLYYADGNENALIFINPSNNELSEKVLKLKQEMVNPFVALRDWLQEEVLDVEAMQLAIEQFYGLLKQEEKLKAKLVELEEDVKKGQQGQVNIFKTIFKKKEDVIAETEKEKEITQQKIADIEEIIKIVGDNLENQMEIFKNDKTNNYYKYLKIFSIMQREANRVIREIWSLVGSSLKDIMPNYDQEGAYPENTGYDDYSGQKEQEVQHEEEAQDQNYAQENEIHDNVENQEQNEEQPQPQEGEGGEGAEGGEGGEEPQE